MNRKRWIILLCLIYVMQSSWTSMAVTDRDILSDPVANVYTANVLGQTISDNLSFSDVPVSHWAKDPITRLGALSIVKGYNENNAMRYRPNGNVSKQEALAFLLRVVGLEAAANQAAENLEVGEDEGLLSIWSKGYLQVAADNGLITQLELDDGLILDQEALDPEFNFIRAQNVSREQVAMWLVQAINIINPGRIEPIYVNNKIFTLSDWQSIDIAFVPYVEAVMQAGIMVGDADRFRPKGSLTRAEMAQVIANIDDILYETLDKTVKGGIVGSISDAGVIGSINNESKRTILIRNDEGLVDQVDLIVTSNELNKISRLDVPVLGPSGVRGLSSLREGQSIAYIVDNTTLEMEYVVIKGDITTTQVKGVLQPLIDIDNGNITVKNTSGVPLTYTLSVGLYDLEERQIKIGEYYRSIDNAPVSETITLTIQNNLVTKIDQEGATPLSSEVSGIVKEINTQFNFITIEKWDGGEITKYFNKDQVRVEKQNYYDLEDEIGYIDEIFPEYGFDERDTGIEAIEVGDVVHLLMSSNGQYIEAISAKTNYNVKFGEIVSMVSYGANGVNIRVNYGDGSIGSLNVDGFVPVLRSSRNIGVGNLQVGQMIKILMNQGVLAPGTVVETVKQIDVDPYGNIYARIYKGDLGYMNMATGTLSLLNSYHLTKTGWSGYNPMTDLELSGAGVEIFHNGNQISLSYADRFLRTDTMQAYVVTEKHYDRERIKKIVFEDGRDDVLASTNVSYSNGYDAIRLISSVGDIGVNPGTIVLKNDHIVSTGSILSPDYAQVVLAGQGRAVIVNVLPEPNNDAISVFRGRISNIETNREVKVESQAILKDMTWIYSPIQREFTLSYDTIIMDESGSIPLSDFIDYSELSKVDEVYTIIAEGTKATHLIKNPYATEGVVGEIYGINGDDTISIKDALVYDSATKLWTELSFKNNYATLEIVTESVIIKNNQVIDIEDLELGDRIRAMVTVDLSEQLKLTDNRQATGYILFVED
ncbi:MAG: S-layer homology domain-containing protein [Vallitaleaceae bacterium]|nr:S-layer homology domain-containing protein [Vallitaleaceae bacterium]